MFTSMILCVIMIISCTSKRNIVGYYTNIPKPHSGFDELILFENGTYSYKFIGHMTGYESSGVWVIDSLQDIYLTSKQQPVNKPNVSEEEILSDLITIKVFERKTGDILPYTNIVLFSNGKKRGLVTDLKGLVEFYHPEKIDSINVSFIGFRDVTYTIKSQNSNSFKVEMDEVNLDYLYLKDEKFIKRNKKLLWLTESGMYRVLKKR